MQYTCISIYIYVCVSRSPHLLEACRESSLQPVLASCPDSTSSIERSADASPSGAPGAGSPATTACKKTDHHSHVSMCLSLYI